MFYKIKYIKYALNRFYIDDYPAGQLLGRNYLVDQQASLYLV